MELTKTELPPDHSENDDPDEEAPYGRKADGTPRKRPGRRPGQASSGGRKTNLDNLKEPLADRLVEYFGPPLGMVSPLALAVLDDRADKTANALCNLATKRPRVRKLVEGIIDGSSSLDLALTGVGLIVAIGVDTQRVDPNSALPRYFKIPQLWQETYGEFSENGNGATAHHGLLGEMQ